MTAKKSTESIKAQLDALEKISLGAAGLIMVLIWSALQNSAEIEIFGITADRENVYVVAALSLSTINLAATLYYLRLRNLLGQVGTSEPCRSLTVITRHQWLMNPFSNFSGDQQLLWSDGACRAFFPFLSTLGCGCLWLIRLPYETWPLLSVMLFYIGCGLLMTWHIVGAVGALDKLSKTIDTIDPPMNMRREGIILSALGIAVGVGAIKLLDIIYYYYSP